MTQIMKSFESQMGNLKVLPAAAYPMAIERGLTPVKAPLSKNKLPRGGLRSLAIQVGLDNNTNVSRR
jgi:hypothetical protein